MTSLSHTELVDLVFKRETAAGHMAWAEIMVGAGEPDVVSVTRIYPHTRGHQVHAFEIKVSRSDFQADIREDKWRKYLFYSHRVSFVVPAGLVKVDEVPALAGLIEYDPETQVWRELRKAPAHKLHMEWPAHMWFALLMVYDAPRRKRQEKLNEMERKIAELKREMGGEEPQEE